VIAVDTNILVYADSPSSEFHAAARALLTRLSEGMRPWAIPWHCIYEYLHVITDPRTLRRPLPLQMAFNDMKRLLQSPSLRLLSETPRHMEVLETLIQVSRVTSSTAHDADIAALCIEHGITEILTADRDFARFPLKVTNPFRP